MALETTKTTYLNGSSKDGGRVLANFSSSLSESGTMTINETISDNANLDTLDTVEADFNDFRELAKNELKKLNGQDTETDVSSDKPVDTKPVDTIAKADSKPEADVPSDKSGDKEVASTTPDNEAVKGSEPVETTTKADSKPEAGTPDEAKVSDVKDSEEAKEPVASEVKQPVVSDETEQPAESEEIKQPVSSEEVKVSDVKDGENVDESNQLRHQ